MAPIRHEFGGFWTQTKLERVAAYLPFFTRAMVGGDYRTVYFDAFAGTGTVDRRKPKKSRLIGFFNFPDPPSIAGSARRALQTAPPFDRYVFVDNNEAHCNELKRLRYGFPELADRINVRRGDANDRVASFCKTTDWSVWRGVFFLDPYDMAVNWDTIKSIAETQAADVWYLFPINATLRMLHRREKPPKSRRLVLDRLFGERDWYQEFYHTWDRSGFFGPRLQTTRHANEKGVIKYFVNRLQSVFEWVSEKPLRLFSANGPLLFHLYFASSILGVRRIYDTVQDILRIYSGARDFPAQFEKLLADKRVRARQSVPRN
jgi:three-Cys-motif partner protein